MNNYCYFTITGKSDGYTIQRAPANTGYYNETEFVGYATDATRNEMNMVQREFINCYQCQLSVCVEIIWC